MLLQEKSFLQLELESDREKVHSDEENVESTRRVPIHRTEGMVQTVISQSSRRKCGML